MTTMRYLPPRRCPTKMHEHRRDVLNSIAILAGFEVTIVLPDGCRPDVARASLEAKAVFLGDAKHTEGPDDLASLARLTRYAAWLVDGGRLHRGILAICHRSGQGRAWSRALNTIASDARMAVLRGVDSRRLAPDAEITWVICAGCRRQSTDKGQRRRTRCIPAEELGTLGGRVLERSRENHSGGLAARYAQASRVPSLL
jgi:hypothetical protein